MSRAPRPDDLFQLRVPTGPVPSPDGRRICCTVKASAPDRDGYRSALWMVPTDGSAPERRLTLGTRRDTTPRWSPDGSTIAFLSDRGAVLAKGGASDRPTDEDAAPHEGHGEVQVWLLPADGGEARQLTRLPEDVQDLAWSPDGTRLCLVAGAVEARARRPDRRSGTPDRDARITDRLTYQMNGMGYIGDRVQNLWTVEVDDGTLRRLTSGSSHDREPAWSPDGTTIAFTSDRHTDPDLSWRSDIHLVAADGGRVRRVSGGRGERSFERPTWSPDGASIAATGHRFRRGNASSVGVWVFDAAGETGGVELVGDDTLDAGAGMNSDLAGIPATGIAWGPDGTWLLFGAPIEGSYELWRAYRDGTRPERLTRGEHALTQPNAVPTGAGLRVALVVGDAVTPWEVGVLDVPPPTRRGTRPGSVRTLTRLMAEWADIDLVAPVTRWHESDGRRIQGWFLEAPRADGRPAPVVVQIHGGPATLYGWALMWEWQCLVASGISVYACNPRGSQGYGEAFCYANLGDWGDGPMADVMAGLDSLIDEDLADPDRLGVTGGSYGGYLTAWIVGHTDRFAAAVSCRGVYDLTSQMLSGDLGGPTFGRLEFGVQPWEDPDLYRRQSPLTYASRMVTPLLIQHAEQDLRCPITQAEELFATLRSMHKPVRLMRTPGESHELTRSGTPYRRVENLERIEEWFVHFLVKGNRRLPAA
jgi:dipeptidyl aminopeptidase/acylaminoacyl peptidase